MANTRYLTTVVEKYIREVLGQEYSQTFAKRTLPLLPGGSHEFDAVSYDRAVVCSVKSASGLTSGGRIPSGKIMGCFAELYFLSLVEAPTRRLILTTPSFHEIFSRSASGRVVQGVTVDCIPLPPDIQANVDHIVRKASQEVSPAVAREAVAAEIEAEAT